MRGTVLFARDYFLRTTQRAALQCAGQTAAHRTKKPRKESSLQASVDLAGVIQQQGELGTINQAMASKIVSNRIGCDYWPGRRCACPTKAFREHNRQRRLKYCTAFSCFFAADRVLNVPRFLLLPVFGFFFREYKR